MTPFPCSNSWARRWASLCWRLWPSCGLAQATAGSHPGGRCFPGVLARLSGLFCQWQLLYSVGDAPGPGCVGRWYGFGRFRMPGVKPRRDGSASHLLGPDSDRARRGSVGAHRRFVRLATACRGYSSIMPWRGCCAGWGLQAHSVMLLLPAALLLFWLRVTPGVYPVERHRGRGGRGVWPPGPPDAVELPLLPQAVLLVLDLLLPQAVRPGRDRRVRGCGDDADDPIA